MSEQDTEQLNTEAYEALLQSERGTADASSAVVQSIKHTARAYELSERELRAQRRAKRAREYIPREQREQLARATALAKLQRIVHSMGHTVVDYERSMSEHSIAGICEHCRAFCIVTISGTVYGAGTEYTCWTLQRTKLAKHDASEHASTLAALSGLPSAEQLAEQERERENAQNEGLYTSAARYCPKCSSGTTIIGKGCKDCRQRDTRATNYGAISTEAYPHMLHYAPYASSLYKWYKLLATEHGTYTAPCGTIATIRSLYIDSSWTYRSKVQPDAIARYICSCKHAPCIAVFYDNEESE